MNGHTASRRAAQARWRVCLVAPDRCAHSAYPAWIVALALTALAAPAAEAAPTARFVAWLASHPGVELVTVSSASGVLDPYSSRFPVHKNEPLPSSARIRIVDERGSLVCVVRAPAEHVCVRGPAAPHLWTDQTLSRERKGGLVEAVLLGPLPDRRVAPYSLQLPQATVRVGKPVPLNPLWIDSAPGPWWAFQIQSPVVGSSRAAMKNAALAPATNEVPEWLADAPGFSSYTTGDPRVLRLETADELAACVRGAKGWLCRSLPPIAADDVHADLPLTDRRLSRQLPVVYRAHAAIDGERIALALERTWIRSKVARTPSLEFTGTFVEVVELGPGASAFTRRAVLEMTSGRMTDIDSRGGFPTVTDFSSVASASEAPRVCVSLGASGVIPPKMRTVPLGRYCATADGRMVPAAGAR